MVFRTNQYISIQLTKGAEMTLTFIILICIIIFFGFIVYVADSIDKEAKKNDKYLKWLFNRRK